MCIKDSSELLLLIVCLGNNTTCDVYIHNLVLFKQTDLKKITSNKKIGALARDTKGQKPYEF